MDLLKYLRTFSRVAERGSFSSAARELGVAQPVASRQVALLEGFYGLRLINRTTRSLALTEEGRALLLHIRPALDAIDTARDSLRTMGSSVSGVVRIGAPVALGLLLGARVKPLLDRNPHLSIELSVGEDFGSMVKEGLDLAVTTDNPPATSLIARRIGESRRLLVASSRYLDQAGTPACVQDLKDHSCVICPAAGGTSTWRFDGPQGQETVPISGQLRCSSAEVVRHAVLRGAGIGLLPEFHVASNIEGGGLHHLLPAYSTAPASIHILYPSRRDLPARTRPLSAFFCTTFRAWWHRGRRQRYWIRRRRQSGAVYRPLPISVLIDPEWRSMPLRSGNGVKAGGSVLDANDVAVFVWTGLLSVGNPSVA